MPGGSYAMGSPPGEVGRKNDEVQHQVSLSPFAISKYDVTFDEYDAYCLATGAEKPSDQGWRRGSRPVIHVGWTSSVAYRNWRSQQEGRKPAYTITGIDVSWDRSANGYRLPTEAEWEYAAKGGPQASSLTPNAIYAGSANIDAVAWYSGNSGNMTHPVGQKAPNSLGLYDMAGNVWQWCWDFYGKYSTAVQNDPSGPVSSDYSHGLRGPDCSYSCVLRGGSENRDVEYVRSAKRGYIDQGGRNNIFGFRLVVSQFGM